MPRYFFALWPDDETRRQLDAVSNMLPAGCGRTLSTDNLHITLVFLGNVADPVIERINLAVGRIKSPAVDLTLDEHGWWKKPQVIWLGTQSIPESLVELAAGLKTIVEDNGVRIDTRPFIPHLTLVRKAKHPLKGFSFPPIHWKIRDFCLVESVTHANGAEYTRRENWTLTST